MAASSLAFSATRRRWLSVMLMLIVLSQIESVVASTATVDARATSASAATEQRRADAPAAAAAAALLRHEGDARPAKHREAPVARHTSLKQMQQHASQKAGQHSIAHAASKASHQTSDPHQHAAHKHGSVKTSTQAATSSHQESNHRSHHSQKHHTDRQESEGAIPEEDLPKTEEEANARLRAEQKEDRKIEAKQRAKEKKIRKENDKAIAESRAEARREEEKDSLMEGKAVRRPKKLMEHRRKKTKHHGARNLKQHHRIAKEKQDRQLSSSKRHKHDHGSDSSGDATLNGTGNASRSSGDTHSNGAANASRSSGDTNLNGTANASENNGSVSLVAIASAFSADAEARRQWRQQRGRLVRGMGHTSVWAARRSKSHAASLLDENDELGDEIGSMRGDNDEEDWQPYYYTISGTSPNSYCHDNVESPVTCSAEGVGVGGLFALYHWETMPHLHVLRGGRGDLWCRDHADFMTCTQEDITTTEEFRIFDFGDGSGKAIKGHAKDSWCRIADRGEVQCKDPVLQADPGAKTHFRITLMAQ
eukprot:TRINITY_DN10802_c0_g3_i2.p1 TRINITY_DN10802_c0_g3~~TRINITY_DN10802_c0_g3_i2.p1  ORF type:complete len:537 (-),score=88.76 TRINITY_DN10802_c0_g3_i2:168-1778(-)